jgi:hypothetical protein
LRIPEGKIIKWSERGLLDPERPLKGFSVSDSEKKITPKFSLLEGSFPFI